MNIAEKIKEYNRLEKQIHNYFDYKEDWVKIPLADQTDVFWAVIDNSIIWAEKPLTLELVHLGQELYGGIIYTQRFLPKFIYEKDDHTMMSVDTQCDGNKFLMVFDNSKKCENEEIKKAYKNKWG